MKTGKKILSLAFATTMAAMALLGAACGDNSFEKEDEYTADGKLMLEYYGIQLDPLQSPTKDTKKVMDYIEDKFNVKFTYTSGSGSSWLNNLNKLIGAGDVPDLFFHDGKEPSYSQWLKDELLYNYSEDLNDYPNIKAQFEKFDDTTLKSYLGGDWYSLPLELDRETEETVISSHCMYYRRDWYEKLVADNYQPESGRALVDPESAEFNYLNFYDLCEGFTKGDLGDLAAKNHSGFACSKDGVYWWHPILSMFNVASDGWTKGTDGTYTMQATSEAAKEAVFFMADMFDKEYMDNDYYKLNQADLYTAFGNGEVGMIIADSAYGNAVNILSLFDKKIPDGGTISDVIKGMPVVTAKDGVKRAKGVYNFYGFTAINNDITDNKKEKILSIMDWMLTEEGMNILNYGLEGTHYTVNSDGSFKSLLGKNKAGYDKYLHDAEVAPGLRNFMSIVSWTNEYLPDTLKYYTEAMTLINTWKQSGCLVLNDFSYVRVPESLTLTFTAVENAITTAYKSIVTTDRGRREQIWTDFVAELNNSRYDAYKQAVNEYANANF